MSKQEELESRVAALERLVAELARGRKDQAASKDWPRSIVGSMSAFPEFPEVVRLGREIRRSQWPDSDQERR